MKIMTVLGTRPEIIRLSRIIPKLDSSCGHVLVHTGQNYDRNLSEVFFEEMGVRAPDHLLSSKAGSVMGQVGKVLSGCEKLIGSEKPDRVLILGDTNSALAADTSSRIRWACCVPIHGTSTRLTPRAPTMVPRVLAA